MPLPIVPVLDLSSPTFSAELDTFFDTTIQAWGAALEVEADAMSMAGFLATSTTSNTIGAGALTFTTETGKLFWPGMWLTVSDAAAPSTNSMTTQITSYNDVTGALVINTPAAGVHGSGNKTSWLIALSGDPTPTGSTVISGDLSLTNVTAAGLIKSTSPSIGIGYATGAGGAVNLTSYPYATLNTICGSLALFSGSLVSRDYAYGYANNSQITSLHDIVVFSLSGANSQFFTIENIPYAVGLMGFRIVNRSTATKNYTGIIINFMIIRNVVA